LRSSLGFATRWPCANLRSQQTYVQGANLYLLSYKPACEQEDEWRKTDAGYRVRARQGCFPN